MAVTRSRRKRAALAVIPALLLACGCGSETVPESTQRSDNGPQQARAAGATAEWHEARDQDGPPGPAGRTNRDSADDQTAAAIRRWSELKQADARADAVRALGRTGPDAGKAVPALVAALEDGHGPVSAAAAETLGVLGAKAASAVPALIKVVEGHGDESTRRAAVEALGRIGPNAKPAVPALVTLLRRRGADAPTYQAQVARALGDIGPGAEAAVPALIKALQDPTDVALRTQSAYALGQVGPASEAAVPTLAAALKDRDDDVRARAAHALGRIGASAREAVPALVDAFAASGRGDGDARAPLVRSSAADALRMIGAPAVPDLARALTHTDRAVRHKAAYALNGMGPAAKEALPALIDALKDDYFGVRYQAAKALGGLGPAAAASVPALTEVLKDRNPFVRDAAAEALKKVGPGRGPAPPSDRGPAGADLAALKKARELADALLRRAVEEALAAADEIKPNGRSDAAADLRRRLQRPRLFEGGVSTQDLVEFATWIHEADRLGLTLNEEAIKRLCRRAVHEYLGVTALDKIASEVGKTHGDVSPATVWAAVGAEFRVEQARRVMQGPGQGEDGSRMFKDDFAKWAGISNEDFAEWFRKNRAKKEVKLP